MNTKPRGPEAYTQGQGHEVHEFYKDKQNDMVNHPPHYKKGKIEVIDFIEDQEYLGFHRCQSIRYITRSPFKGTEIQDLKKAIWYLDRKISQLEVGNG
jgi:hypothetical protein